MRRPQPCGEASRVSGAQRTELYRLGNPRFRSGFWESLGRAAGHSWEGIAEALAAMAAVFVFGIVWAGAGLVEGAEPLEGHSGVTTFSATLEAPITTERAFQAHASQPATWSPDHAGLSSCSDEPAPHLFASHARPNSP